MESIKKTELADGQWTCDNTNVSHSTPLHVTPWTLSSGYHVKTENYPDQWGPRACRAPTSF